MSLYTVLCQVSVAIHCNTFPEATATASNNLKSISPSEKCVTFACPNVWHCALIDHLALCILGFCAASSFNDGSVSPFPARMRLLQHAIPQGTLLHAAFFFFFFFAISPPLFPTSQADARGTQSALSGSLQETHAVISPLGESLPYGEEMDGMKKKKLPYNLNGDDNLEVASVTTLCKTEELFFRLGDAVNNWQSWKKKTGFKRFCFEHMLHQPPTLQRHTTTDLPLFSLNWCVLCNLIMSVTMSLLLSCTWHLSLYKVFLSSSHLLAAKCVAVIASANAFRCHVFNFHKYITLHV